MDKDFVLLEIELSIEKTILFFPDGPTHILFYTFYLTSLLVKLQIDLVLPHNE